MENVDVNIFIQRLLVVTFHERLLQFGKPTQV